MQTSQGDVAMQTACQVGPKLLVCHDLQGGYGQDSLFGGGTDPEQFALYAWHLIDTFVYFSHSLVTIPPPGWTGAAHLHGVKVICHSAVNPSPEMAADGRKAIGS